MKKLIIAAIVAIAAAGQAEAAPIFRPAPGLWYQGSWTCTIAHASNMKLFMTLGMHAGRAAVRQYPYYGKTEYTQLRRIGFGRFTAVTFMGRNASLSLRRSSEGVMTGSGRIGTTIMLLTCSKS
jgi:hypothetical protein